MWPFKSKTKEQTPTDKKSVGISEVVGNFQVGRPVFSSWDIARAIREGYKASSWVFACVTKLMDSSSSVPWRVQRETEPEVWENSPDHPLQKLIDKPNKSQTWGTFIELFTAHLYLGGNAFLAKVRNGANRVMELTILPPGRVEVIPGRDILIEKYVYNRGDTKIDIKAEDMIHLLFPDPGSLFLGISPLQAGAKTVDTDIEAVNWNKVSLQNRTVPDSALIFKDKLSKDQWQNTRDRINEDAAGSDNARRMLIIGGDANVKEMSRSPVDMDFIKGRQFTREEICAIFGIPPPVVGIYDKATLANIETARRIFWEDTVIPYLTGVMEALNFALTPDFEETGLRLIFDVSKVAALRSILKGKVETSKILWDMGVPFNVINQTLELGFDEVVGGDVGWISGTLNPAGVAGGEGDSL